MSLLLLSKHDLETIKVSQVLANGTLSKLLGNSSFSKLGFNPGGSPNLSEGLGTSTTWHSDLEAGQVGVLDEEGLTSNSGALDQDTVQVNDFNDASQLSGILSLLNQDDAADFNEFIESLIKRKRKIRI